MIDKILKFIYRDRYRELEIIRNNKKALIKKYKSDAMKIDHCYSDEGSSAYSIEDFDNKDLVGFNESYKFPSFVRIGTLTPDHSDSRIVNAFTLPIIFPFSKTNATAAVINQDNAGDIHNLFLNIALRMILSLPKGMCKLKFVDNNYGRAFNQINRISQQLIGSDFFTYQSGSDATDKMINLLEKTIIETNQRVLITERTLVEYNEKEDSMKSPYTFVFISNYPSGFTQESSERLINIISNGYAASAGVFLFISINEEIQPSRGVDVERLKCNSSVIYQNLKGEYVLNHPEFPRGWNGNYSINLDFSFPQNIETIISIFSGKRELDNAQSFTSYYEKRIQDGDFWKAESTDEIKIPIGYVNQQEIQYLQFGRNTNDYFGLIGGLPRMGKTNLLHNIILWGAIEYSPFELNYFLIDCKNGTGFNPYKKLPHVKVLSISNDREFGASSLDYLIQEIIVRSEVFKKESDKRGIPIEDIQTYRNLTQKKMPRIMAIVDEFQVLFENEDKIARKVSGRLNKLFREGPAFGISILLCSQGIGRLDVPISNVTWRLSFRLESSLESRRIIGNEEALGLIGVGNAIINNSNGIVDNNIHFQVAHLGDEKYDLVDRLKEVYSKKYPNVPLDQYISDGDNNGYVERNRELLRRIVEDSFEVNNRFCDIFIGEPAFIREKHPFIRIRRQQLSNIVLVGTDIKSAVTIVGFTNYLLAKQSSVESGFYVVDCLNIDNDYYGKLQMLGKYIQNFHYSYSRDITNIIEEVYEELEKRMAAESEGRLVDDLICLSIVNAQNCRKLKKEGARFPSEANQLFRIIKEGPEYGIHTIIHSFSYNDLMEIMNNSILNEFENRIALYGGNAIKIISETTSLQVQSHGTALLQTPDEYTTYNPDLIRVYSKFDIDTDDCNDNINFIKEMIEL